ncbi:hypothetical protein MRB53_040822 [Persea americana]|nr:hypothetical protein MRB53_040822 [Persea americana]
MSDSQDTLQQQHHLGLIGPGRIWKRCAYHSLLYAFPIGALLPIPVYLIARHRKNSLWQYVNMPVLLSILTWVPPAGGLNISSWAFTGFLSNVVKRARPDLWQRYNFVASAALDMALAVALVVGFFTLVYTNYLEEYNLEFGTWLYKDTCDWNGCPNLELEAGQIFGRESCLSCVSAPWEISFRFGYKSRSGVMFSTNAYTHPCPSLDSTISSPSSGHSSDDRTLLNIDACLPYPAVTADGHVSLGLLPMGMKNSAGCRNSPGQVYGRMRAHRGSIGLMYGWYFPKSSSLTKLATQAKVNGSTMVSGQSRKPMDIQSSPNTPMSCGVMS